MLQSKLNEVTTRNWVRWGTSFYSPFYCYTKITLLWSLRHISAGAFGKASGPLLATPHSRAALLSTPQPVESRGESVRHCSSDGLISFWGMARLSSLVFCPWVYLNCVYSTLLNKQEASSTVLGLCPRGPSDTDKPVSIIKREQLNFSTE